MKNMSKPLFGNATPTCSGTGLVTLDVFINDKTKSYPSLWAGGSCGNVLIILAYLGWKTYPIICLGKDSAAERIINDMRMWNVKTDLIFRSDKTVTPIVVEKLYNSGESAFHEFKFKCPYCGSPLPRNRPLPSEFLDEAENIMPINQAFYFDRTSGPAYKLAKKAKSQGALVIFEPHRIGSRKIFKKSIELAHIVKYSREQIETEGLSENALLEIQTMGSRGLRYKFREKENISEWKEKRAFQVPQIMDTAGAGDWCTAGLIHVVGKKGVSSLRGSSIQDVEDALRFGQALAALKCGYEGARGLMYSISSNKLESLLSNLNNGDLEKPLSLPTPRFSTNTSLPTLCPSCKSKI